MLKVGSLLMLSLDEKSLEMSLPEGNLLGSKSKPRLGLLLGVVAEVVGVADEDP